MIGSRSRAAGGRGGWAAGRALAVVVLLAVCAVASSVEAADVDRLIERAEHSYHSGDLKTAAKLFAKADRKADGESMIALRGLARSTLVLLRLDDAVAASERWRRLAATPQERAEVEHHLALALHWRGLTERWRAARKRGAVDGEPPAPSRAGDESLRAASEAYRRSLAELGESRAGRNAAMLGLAEVLTWLGERDSARNALEEYSAAGGRDPLADDLRCQLAVLEKADGEGEHREHEIREIVEGEVEPPVKVRAPAPRYPPTARAARLEGVIVLRLVVTREGRVECARPLLGDPIPLAYAAMSTVRTWRFEPARLRGEPVDVYYNLTVNFELR